MKSSNKLKYHKLDVFLVIMCFLCREKNVWDTFGNGICIVASQLVLLILLFVINYIIVTALQYSSWYCLRNHSEAQTFCEGEGGILASFANQDNINLMVQKVPELGDGKHSLLWTGLKYTQSNGTWSFIDRVDTTFAVSKVSNLSQPVYSDQCVTISSNWILNVTNCTEEKIFFCQNGELPTDSPTAILTG